MARKRLSRLEADGQRRSVWGHADSDDPFAGHGKLMMHARGASDNNLFGGDDVNPSPLGGELLEKAKGFWVEGEASGRPYWVAVFWRGELGSRVELRGSDAPRITERLHPHLGHDFEVTPNGRSVPLSFDDPVSILAALRHLSGTFTWGGHLPPGFPIPMDCIPDPGHDVGPDIDLLP